MLDPDTLELVRNTTAAAHDKKAFNVTALDVSDLTSFTDAFILCS
jgi:ribosomal silencing factor RsfS